MASYAQEDVSRATLRGIKSIHVAIESTDTSQFTENLQVQTELALRKVGIDVAPEPGAGIPILLISLSGPKAPEMNSDQVWVLQLHLAQAALLKRNSQLVMAFTWSRTAAEPGEHAAIRGRLSNMLDRFLNDFLAVNPITSRGAHPIR